MENKNSVTVNSGLEFLRYNIGKPAVFEETIDYIVKKNNIIDINN